MEREERLRRRVSFDRIAERYDRYRPGLPDGVVADVIASGNLRAGSRVLEIGCGTGQLSVPLAAHGVELLAVELGPALAERARRNLAAYPSARVEVGAFEEWALPPEPFDAVVCSNAFHWIDEDARAHKTARALRPGGTLVVVAPTHVGGHQEQFFTDTNRCYVQWGLSDDPSWQPPEAEDVPPSYTELDASGEFRSVSRDRFTCSRTFRTPDYIGLLGTDSAVNGLEDGARAGFLADIARVIDGRYGGMVIWNDLYEIVVATRR